MKNQDLPLLEPEEVTILKRLCGEGRVVPLQVGGKDCLLAFDPRAETEVKAPHLLSLGIGGEPAKITVHFSPQGLFYSLIPGGVIPEEPSVVRKAVIALLCRGILDALSSRLSLPIEVLSPSVQESEFRPLAFTIRRQDAGDDTPPEAWGILHLCNKALSALISSTVAWPRIPGPLAGSVAVEGRVLLTTLEIPTAELASLAPGDVILIGRPGEISPMVKLPDGRTFKCPLPSLGELSDSSASLPE